MRQTCLKQSDFCIFESIIFGLYFLSHRKTKKFNIIDNRQGTLMLKEHYGPLWVFQSECIAHIKCEKLQNLNWFRKIANDNTISSCLLNKKHVYVKS